MTTFNVKMDYTTIDPLSAFIKAGTIRPKVEKVEKVIYNEPATIVVWGDGTKTVVKCHEEDIYDPEKGFLLCCAKKLFGNGGRYNDVMREHVEPEKKSRAIAMLRKFEEMVS